MNFGAWLAVSVAAWGACAADSWRWPQQAASLRIDTKVRFIDGADYDRDRRGGAGNIKQGSQVSADEAPFHEAQETDGFYNRPRDVGRYPVRVLDGSTGHLTYSPRKHNRAEYSDGTLDSLQYCKCVDTPDCGPRRDSQRACGSGKFLCCYNKPIKPSTENSEFFNEIDDERPSLLPGREPLARPFPPPPGSALGDRFGPGQGHDFAAVGAAEPGVLVGPGGPTGVVGPADSRRPTVLVGPGGPTGSVGPRPLDDRGLGELAHGESAQRGVLVGPGGPTGIVGPAAFGQRPRLVGPGGPTGIVGPRMRGYLGGFFDEYAGRPGNPGVLVGPGGPTGVIGPGRSLLVGPGGPTGAIGPHFY